MKRSFHAPTLLTLAVIGVALVGSRFTQPTPATPTLSDEVFPIACEDIAQDARFQAADLVLTGSVFAIVPNNDGSADVLITPDKIYKGFVPAAGVVLAARPAAAGGALSQSLDLHFTSSDPPYLLVLTSRDDGRYNTSTCDGSRLLGDGLTAEEQDALSQ